MKLLLAALAAVLVVISLYGCDLSKAAQEEDNSGSWKESPYYRVTLDENNWDIDETQAWVKGELGDRIFCNYVNTFEQKRRNPRSAYLLHKDGRQQYLPLIVHHSGESFRLQVIHLVDKDGRECCFLKP